MESMAPELIGFTVGVALYFVVHVVAGFVSAMFEGPVDPRSMR